VSQVTLLVSAPTSEMPLHTIMEEIIMNDTTLDKKEIIARLNEIREACSVATSMNDTNLNAIIEEIDRLVKTILELLDTPS